MSVVCLSGQLDYSTSVIKIERFCPGKNSGKEFIKSCNSIFSGGVFVIVRVAGCYPVEAMLLGTRTLNRADCITGRIDSIP